MRVFLLIALSTQWSNAYGQIRDIVAVSAASFEAGIPAKGSLASVLCTGLTGINGTITANQLPLPTALGGVQVRVGGVLAPLLAVTAFPGYQQINLQVPNEAVFEGGPQGTSVDISVIANGQSASARAAVRQGPGDFFGVFQHADDYSLVTAQNPARRGEAIIAYLTGLPGIITRSISKARSPIRCFWA